MVSALWANSNYDDDKGTRQNAVADIEEHFAEAARGIVAGYGGAQVEEEIDESNPFFAPALKASRELDAKMNQIQGQAPSGVTSQEEDWEVDQ